MMLATQLIALSLILAPSLVSAGMFPEESLVKMLDVKTFKKAMEANESSMVAFVAPWCGHCQKMVPEYSKAALGLYPLVPAYAVNCHAEKNKRLCAEQGVQGFPTIKAFPRGASQPPVLYEAAERTASNFFYFITRLIPKSYNKIYRVEDVPEWIKDNTQKYRALLFSKDKKVPLLWQVLANKYSGTEIEFAYHKDRKGKSSEKMGWEIGGPKEPKVMLYPIGSTKPTRYQGIHKQDSLSKFFDSVLEGTADLTQIVEEAKAEEFVQDEKEAEIEKKQEAQRIALLHGGYTDLIDFEKALKNGGADYHGGGGGYGGVMGSIPEHFKKTPETQAPESASISAGTAPVTTAPAPTPEAQVPLKDEL